MNAFRSHREELDEILENPNDFQDKMMRAVKSNDFYSSLLPKIDEWHIFPIKKNDTSSSTSCSITRFQMDRIEDILSRINSLN